MRRANLVLAGVLAITATVTATATISRAEDEYDRKHAGTRGYVTAYDSDNVTIIDVDACPGGYTTCGSAFRERIDHRMCSRHGTGRHTWYYQVGDSRTKVPNTATCKDGAGSGSGSGSSGAASASASGDADSYDRRNAGTKNHVTAYEADRTTIIDVDPCPKGYAVCGSAFRESIKDRLCRKHGTGRHTWYYQIGDSGTKIVNTANCK